MVLNGLHKVLLRCALLLTVIKYILLITLDDLVRAFRGAFRVPGSRVPVRAFRVQSGYKIGPAPPLPCSAYFSTSQHLLVLPVLGGALVTPTYARST